MILLSLEVGMSQEILPRESHLLTEVREIDVMFNPRPDVDREHLFNRKIRAPLYKATPHVLSLWAGKILDSAPAEWRPSIFRLNDIQKTTLESLLSIITADPLQIGTVTLRVGRVLLVHYDHRFVEHDPVISIAVPFLLDPGYRNKLRNLIDHQMRELSPFRSETPSEWERLRLIESTVSTILDLSCGKLTVFEVAFHVLSLFHLCSDVSGRSFFDSLAQHRRTT